jgi:hypothetical protein
MAKVGPARKRKKVEAMRIEETRMGVLRKKVLGWSRAVVVWRERGNGLNRTVVRRDKAKAEAARKTRAMGMEETWTGVLRNKVLSWSREMVAWCKRENGSKWAVEAGQAGGMFWNG